MWLVRRPRRTDQIARRTLPAANRALTEPAACHSQDESANQLLALDLVECKVGRASYETATDVSAGRKPVSDA